MSCPIVDYESVIEKKGNEMSWNFSAVGKKEATIAKAREVLTRCASNTDCNVEKQELLSLIARIEEAVSAFELTDEFNAVRVDTSGSTSWTPDSKLINISSMLSISRTCILI